MPSSPARPLRAVKAPPEARDSAGDPDDPRITMEVERTLEAFRHLLPPEALEELRDNLLGFATTHPAMKEMWSRLRPRPVPASSGVVATEKGK